MSWIEIGKCLGILLVSYLWICFVAGPQKGEVIWAKPGNAILTIIQGCLVLSIYIGLLGAVGWVVNAGLTLLGISWLALIATISGVFLIVSGIALTPKFIKLIAKLGD